MIKLKRICLPKTEHLIIVMSPKAKFTSPIMLSIIREDHFAHHFAPFLFSLVSELVNEETTTEHEALSK